MQQYRGHTQATTNGGAWVPTDDKQFAQDLCQCHQRGYNAGLFQAAEACPYARDSAEALMWLRGYFHGATLRQAQQADPCPIGKDCGILQRALEGDR